MAGQIDVVVFDMGGVACHFEPDRRITAMAELTGRSPDDIREAIFGSGLDERAERGELDRDQAYAAEIDALGGSLTGDQLRHAMARSLDPDAAVLELVGRVDRPTALFTNNGPVVGDCLARELRVVGDAFDHVILSWELGADKPNPEAYQRVAERLGVEPAAILFFDDSAANVEGAHRSGWEAHPFTDAAAATAILEARSLL